MTAAAETAALRPVPGPSALGGGRRRFFQLTWLMASTEFKLNYFGTALGYVWSLMRPLLLFGVLYLVFTRVIRFGGTVEHYPTLLLLNLMLWSFFAESTTQAVTCVQRGENIVRKMQFPRLVIPLSVVLTSLFNLCLNLIVVVIFMLATHVEARLTWLALPLIVAVLVLISTGTSLLLSALFVRFRDVAQIWSVLVLVLFYSTPILYPIEFIPHSLRFALFVNPFDAVFTTARQLLIDPSAPSFVDAAGSTFGIVAPAVVVVALCAIGFRFFTREAQRIAEDL
jgi:ABC-2 type transport system permease protein